MSKEFYKIRNKADALEIDIDGDIGPSWGWFDEGGDNTKEHVKALLKDIANSAASQIVVNINSVGGDVNHGISIHDLLAGHKAKVITIVHGMTASAATIIAQAGDTRKMSANALYLIHPASTIAWGNCNAMEEALTSLKKVDETLANIYAKRTGKSAEEITDLMNRFDGNGEWLTADEALDLGLIDEIIEPMKAVAHVNAKDLARLGLPQIPSNKLSDMTPDKKTVFAWFKEFTAKIIGKEDPENPPAEPPADPTAEDPKPDPPPAADPAPPAEPPAPEASREVVIRDMEEVRTVLDDLTNQIAERDTRIQNLTDEVARLKGTPTVTDPKEDPALDKAGITTNKEAHDANAKALRG